MFRPIQLRCAVAVQPLRGGVARTDGAVQVLGDDRVQRRLDNGRQVGVRLVALLPRDVLVGDQPPHGLPGRATDRRHPDRDVDTLAPGTQSHRLEALDPVAAPRAVAQIGVFLLELARCERRHRPPDEHGGRTAEEPLRGRTGGLDHPVEIHGQGGSVERLDCCHMDGQGESDECNSVGVPGPGSRCGHCFLLTD